MKTSAIILAAGQGTRMKSALPKVLHNVAGQPLLLYPIRLCQSLGIRPINIIVSKATRHLEDELDEKGLLFSIQYRQVGTGHATMVGIRGMPRSDGSFLILCGDMPLITKKTLQQLIKTHNQKKAAVSFVSVAMKEPGNYGRVVRHQDGRVEIVEASDITAEQKNINEVNMAIYCVRGDFLEKTLKRLNKKNKQKEYYLPDIIKLAQKDGEKVHVLQIKDEQQGWGINTQEQRAQAEQALYQQRRQDLMAKGVQIIGPDSVVIDPAVKVGAGTTLYGPCYLLGQTSIGKDCTIEPGVVIKNSQLKNNITVKAYSYLDQAKADDQTNIGPFSHLRPGSVLSQQAKVGNFSEVKKATIGPGSKVNHLSYVGDAKIGKNVNIGAGTITCNYDGIAKHQTTLQDGVFVGSDTQFVAPVTVGKNATIGAGSTITKNVAAGSLALTRSQQKQIKNWKKKKSKGT